MGRRHHGGNPADSVIVHARRRCTWIPPESGLMTEAACEFSTRCRPARCCLASVRATIRCREPSRLDVEHPSMRREQTQDSRAVQYPAMVRPPCRCRGPCTMAPNREAAVSLRLVQPGATCSSTSWPGPGCWWRSRQSRPSACSERPSHGEQGATSLGGALRGHHAEPRTKISTTPSSLPRTPERAWTR